MPIYLVETSWIGNGSLGVIVEAESKDDAFRRAQTALIRDEYDQLAKWGDRPPDWAKKSSRLKIQSFGECQGFRAKELDLPYVGEFG